LKASYKIIRWLLGDKFFDKKLKKFKEFNPNRFYVENIRSYYGMSYFFAKRLCDEAVSVGRFDKKIGLECPECNRIIKSINNISEFNNETITCETCESLEHEHFKFKIKDVKKIDIYSLHKA
jgi:hypothetical protein